ncbi:MAG: hypothetical protein ABIH26_15310 [Candidatus Eisenbacteria bacterium]
MRSGGCAALILAAGAAMALAGTGEVPADRVVLANQTVHVGRILSLDATDLLIQENRRDASRLLPLAEVREIRWGDGSVRVLHPIEDPDLDGADLTGASLRSSPYIRAEDLVLTRREVVMNALPRGVLAGAVATFCTRDGDGKKIAFAAGFLVQFGISLHMGW